MRKVILLILIFLVIFSGLILGPALVEYDGYVLIVMEDGTMQLRIFGVLLLLVGFGLVSWFTIWAVKRLVHVFSGSKSWLWGWSARKQQKAFSEGMLALAAGDYSIAQKQLAKIEGEDFDGVNLLAAAEAELQTGNPQRAVLLWEQALDYPKAVVPSKLNLVRHYLSTGNIAEAQSIIESIDDRHFKLKSVVEAAAMVLTRSGKWRELESKLAKWKKILGNDYAYWQQQASQGTFAEIASKDGALQLKKSWSEKPRSAKRDPAQQAAYTKQLLTQQMFNDAQDALLDFQKAGPQAELLPLMRELKVKNATHSVKKLEDWIKADDLNAELYSILGELAFNSGDLVLAEKALGKAISLSNNHHDLQLIAAIKEQQNDHKLALQFYKESVNAANK